MKKPGFIIIAMLVICFSQAVLGEKIEKSFNLEKGRTVTLDFTDIDGSVFLQSHEQDTIVFQFEKWNPKEMSAKVATYFKKIQPDIHFSDNHLEIEVRYPNGNISTWFSSSYRHIQVESRLTVPVHCNLRIKTVDGNIELKNVTGKIECKTTDGNVSVSQLKESIAIRTIDGNISATDISGGIYMKSIDGNINIERFSGELEIRSTDGNLILEEGNGALTASTVDGTIRAHGIFTHLQSRTTDGNSRFVILPKSSMKEDWKFVSSDGGIELELPPDLGFKLTVRTGDGHIRASRLHLDTITEKRKNRLSGSRGTGQQTIFVSTGDGGVRIMDRPAKDR